MDRLFLALGIAALLAAAPVRGAQPAQPVFFSLLFPQLMPPDETAPGWPWSDAIGEAVLL